MPRPPWLVLAATSLAAFTATLDNTVVAVALRDMQRDLSAGVTGLQGVVTAYAVALAALLLTGGTLADVLGRRRVFVAGLAVFAAASAACALAGSVEVLVVARAVQGAGAALVLPGSLAVLASAYPDPGRRARAVGIWAATGALALVMGPIVGGLLVAASGWPAIFWVNLPLCALVAAVALLAPAGPAIEVGRRLDLTGQLLGAAVLAAGTYAVVLAGRDGLGTPVVVSLLVALVAAVLFVVVERRAPDPVLPLELLRQRRFVGATSAAFATSLAIFVLLVFLSLYLQLVQQREALDAGLRLLPLTAALVVTAPFAGRLAARYGPGLPAVTGLLVAGSGLVVTAVVLTRTTGGLALSLLLVLTGIGLGLTAAPVVAAALDAVQETRSGLAAAAVNVARELGGVVAVGGLGALVVSRLTGDLVDKLVAQGAARGPASGLVDFVLEGASQGEIVRAAQGVVPLEALLQLRVAAAESFVTSVRVALVGGAIVLALSALVVGRSLRR